VEPLWDIRGENRGWGENDPGLPNKGSDTLKAVDTVPRQGRAFRLSKKKNAKREGTKKYLRRKTRQGTAQAQRGGGGRKSLARPQIDQKKRFIKEKHHEGEGAERVKKARLRRFERKADSVRARRLDKGQSDRARWGGTTRVEFKNIKKWAKTRFA